MNRATYEKLKKNPHYKLNPKQVPDEDDEDHMVEFGQPNFHDNSIHKHPTGPSRVARKSKDVLE